VRKNFFILMIIGSIFASCGGASNGGVGTGVDNPPTVPTSSLAPDAESLILESTLGSEDDDESIIRILGIPNQDRSGRLDLPADWPEIFTDGPVAQARIYRRSFEDWSADALAVLQEDEDFELSATPNFFNLGNARLIDATAPWGFAIGQRNDDAIKVVIRNLDTDLIQGYYLFETDDDGEPVRGLFSYVNPQTLAEDSTEGVHFFTLTYDFQDSENARMAITFDQYSEELGHFVLFNIKYECDAISADCLGEFLSITSRPPEREFSTQSVRYGWNDDSQNICLAPVTYSDEVALGETQEFTGPNTPNSGEINKGECEIDRPFWGSTILTPSNLPRRFADDADGDLAGRVFGDGSTDDTWEAELNSDTVDNWLVGIY